MAKAVVLNLTDRAITLRTHDGDSVTVPPSHSRPAQINAAFLNWMPPNPQQLKILYYINDQGQRVNDLNPPVQEPEIPGENPEAENSSDAPPDDSQPHNPSRADPRNTSRS